MLVALVGQSSRQPRFEMSKQLYMLIYRHESHTSEYVVVKAVRELRIEGRIVEANLRDCTIEASVTVATKIDDVKQELSTQEYIMRVTTPLGELYDKYVLNVRRAGCVTETEILSDRIMSYTLDGSGILNRKQTTLASMITPETIESFRNVRARVGEP